MNVRKELSTGIIITFISKYSNVIIQLILGAILARLLSPEEFGVVAIITVFTNFFNLISSAGINTAIIQDKSLDEESNSILFNYSIIIGILLCIIFYICSYFISKLYNNSVYIYLGKILLISIFFYTITSVPLALINKKRMFKKVAIINVSSNLVSGIISVVLAFMGFSYYSLVIQTTIKAMLLFFISYYYADIKYQFKINFKPLKQVYSYAGFDFLFNFINYFSRNSDNFLIGKFLGSISLGYYDKAYRFMLYPIQTLTQVITPVLHPILSNYQNNSDKIRRVYEKVIYILAILGIVISVILFFSANEVIVIMFGKQWDKSIPAFKILTVSIWVQVILSSSGAIFRSCGRTDLLFKSGLLSAIVTVTGIVIGTLYFKSLEVVSIMIVISYFINFIQSYYLMYNKIFKIPLVEFLKILIKPLAIGITMVIIYIMLDINISNILISIIVKILVGVTTFIFLALITREYLIIKLVKKVTNIYNKKFKKYYFN